MFKQIGFGISRRISRKIYPGHYTKTDKGFVCTPLQSTIKSTKSEKNNLNIAVPGGLITIGLDLDPSLCQNDRLIGNIAELKGYCQIIILEGMIYNLNNHVIYKSKGNFSILKKKIKNNK